MKRTLLAAIAITLLGSGVLAGEPDVKSVEALEQTTASAQPSEDDRLRSYLQRLPLILPHDPSYSDDKGKTYTREFVRDYKLLRFRLCAITKKLDSLRVEGVKLKVYNTVSMLNGEQVFAKVLEYRDPLISFEPYVLRPNTDFKIQFKPTEKELIFYRTALELFLK